MNSDEIYNYLEAGVGSGKDVATLKGELVSRGVHQDLVNTVTSEFLKIRERMPKAPAPGSVSKRLYPIFIIDRNQNPNRFYATPMIGGIVKTFMLIPVVFMLWFAILCLGVSLLINPFVVLFTGKFWTPAYNWVVKYASLQTKIYLFVNGLTDKYPGFHFAIRDSFILNIPYPTVPSKLYAIPLLGFAIRFVLLLPFAIFAEIILNSASVMAIFSSFSVFFKKYYPESTHEFVRDSIRLELAGTLYSTGISDTLPTYKISKNHLLLKLLFIVPGIILMLLNNAGNLSSLYEPKEEPKVERLSPYSPEN